MPTFDFQCTACSHVFEFQRPFGSKTVPVCPACKSKRTEKLIAPPVIAFKGEGFYKTDSSKTTSKPAPKTDEKPVSEAKEKPVELPSASRGQPEQKKAPSRET